MIEALIDFNDGCGNFYRYRAYFLASEVIDQFKDCSLADEIIRQLLKWSYTYFREEQQEGKVFLEPLVEAATAAIEATDRERVIAAFVRIINTTENNTVLRLAAERLGKLAPGNQTALAVLVRLIQVTQNTETLSELESNLLEIGLGNETEIAALVQLLHKVHADSRVEEPYISNAFYFLEKIGDGSQTAINGLIHLMETTLDKDFCHQTIEVLRRIGYGNQTAIAALALFQFLETIQDEWTRWGVIQSLLRIDPGDKTALAAFYQLLETVQDEWKCYVIAKRLLEIAPSNELALASLSRLLEITKH